MNAHLLALHRQPSAPLLAALTDAVDAQTPEVVRTVQMARDGDRSALDRLERVAERCGGLGRLANQARDALYREIETTSPEAA